MKSQIEPKGTVCLHEAWRPHANHHWQCLAGAEDEATSTTLILCVTTHTITDAPPCPSLFKFGQVYGELLKCLCAPRECQKPPQSPAGFYQCCFSVFCISLVVFSITPMQTFMLPSEINSQFYQSNHFSCVFNVSTTDKDHRGTDRLLIVIEELKKNN